MVEKIEHLIQVAKDLENFYFVNKLEEILKQQIMENFKVKFNVAEICEYGNAGGKKITMFPLEEIRKEKNINGKIEIHVPNNEGDFETGVYSITFTKEK